MYNRLKLRTTVKKILSIPFYTEEDKILSLISLYENTPRTDHEIIDMSLRDNDYEIWQEFEMDRIDKRANDVLKNSDLSKSLKVDINTTKLDDILKKLERKD